MNANMKTLQDFELRQKISQFGVQTAGNIVTAGVVVFLVLAWLLTDPFVQLGNLFAGNGKVKTKNN